ncbi:cell wall biogenesis protein phosphatase Ssd1 [Nannizzia gypsea CBS 118893]|uniref:Cell wall biogenesis protein phosphatase Ssd1 n=1 Tax=Arthroderma gypseum (strain ATCC MYA-4604 / CBS 118893) TaxID=535722 RepID=E4UTJ1_ARTGP|nr:cell wall biogenesis protein phosphatase Ssd1 [Nannizzia gypsea CBS 118893]EFR01536.1 cell wall biogenesis protein phosphatase Ssd1 [Nannizzia gypsea CBS 118893]
MDSQGSQGNSGPPRPSGRPIHIAHRRSPSEMTPLIMEQLALQQQIEVLQQHQQQIAAQHQQNQQFLNIGMIPQQQMQQMQPLGYPQMQGQGVMPVGFQFPQMQGQQHLGVPNQSSHRRNQSALPNVGMGPPPAPSSGAAGAQYGENGQGSGRDNNNNNQSRKGGAPAGGSHHRRHSLALPEAKKAAEMAQQRKANSAFKFPIPGGAGATSSSPVQGDSNDDKQGEPSSTAPSQPSPLAGLGVQRSGNIRGAHLRSQSMAVGNPRQYAGRNTPTFQFPQTGETSGSPGPDAGRRTSHAGHGRSGSRNFDSNWRQQGGPPNNNSNQDPRASLGGLSPQPQQGGNGFQPGHRARGSVSSMSAFQFPNTQQLFQLPQGQVVLPQMYQGQQQQLLHSNALQLAQLQALQQSGQLGSLPQNLQLVGQQQAAQPQQQSQSQSQQNRKTLFTPYLAQTVLPRLFEEGKLVTGILRVNKKNRSDAYVTCAELDADIFICGSKDRNRALEGDLVAVELLDVDEVWNQKREKEEKKKRKDIDTRSGSSAGLDRGGRSDSNATADMQQIGPDGSIRRRGSLRQRPTQKKNDDVEVEGQSLLLVEEDEISDEHKPLYAGHIIAVVDRAAHQIFAGSLGLLRPSSQATKEKQEAERQARDGYSGRPQHDRHQERPKIVWFKPTDKRVPLIAIPTEQAPRDFVDRHADYANTIFVATVKRWPITSLHPFGTLCEQLGPMGNLKVEIDALLRDNNFAADDFPASVLDKIGFEDWSIGQENPQSLASRTDFREYNVFTIDPNEGKAMDNAFHVRRLDDNTVEIGIHVADVARFVDPSGAVEREAKKRVSSAFLMNRIVNMLPPQLAHNVMALLPGKDSLAVSVVLQVSLESGAIVDQPWIGKSIVNSKGKLCYAELDKIIKGTGQAEVNGISVNDVKLLTDVSSKLREARLGHRAGKLRPLRLLYQLDDENVPVQQNIFNASPGREAIDELTYMANHYVAKKIFAAFPENALLRRQALPNFRRLATFVERMSRLGYQIDPTSSGTLQNSLFKVENDDVRKSMETLLIKTLNRGKYYTPPTVRDDHRSHYMLNLPIYTHFTNPSRRYADIVVHRQLEAALAGATEWPDELDYKALNYLNSRKDSAQNAQEQSVHFEACHAMDKKRKEIEGDLIAEGIVLCVYESAFDVLIPEYGCEKRVHCDQLPLKKAEFRKDDRVLELYWEKGVPSSTYIPEDERPKSTLSGRAASQAAAAREAEEARKREQEREEAQRISTETNTVSPNDVDALFDDDDDALTDSFAGVSLNSPDRSTQSMPPSPRNGPAHPPHRTHSDPRIATTAGETTNEDGEDGDDGEDGEIVELSPKEKYGHLFQLREEDGEYIQDVRELTRVPIILKIDLSKSPPCLTIRSMNPYAL